MRAFEDNESEAGDELLPVADAVPSNDLLVWLELGDRERHSDLAPVVIHIEKLLTVLVEEGDALD